MNEVSNKKSEPVLKGIGVIFRHVDDLVKARDFYGNALGLKQLWQAHDGATAYITGSGPIIIVDKKQNRMESEVLFNMETSDISHAYRSMQENGVDVSGIKIVGKTSMFFFKDPDGNTMMIWANHLPEQDLPQYCE